METITLNKGQIIILGGLPFELQADVQISGHIENLKLMTEDFPEYTKQVQAILLKEEV